jgi:CheY-like chemotaxis protein
MNKNNKVTILVAEDEEYNFFFIEELLIDMDYKLIHTENGIETVDVCKTNPNVKMILMDIKMPVMDGFSATKIIKELFPKMPIIAQSAYILEHDKYKNAFDDFLPKPIKEKDLKQIIVKYLNQNL